MLDSVLLALASAGGGGAAGVVVLGTAVLFIFPNIMLTSKRKLHLI